MARSLASRIRPDILETIRSLVASGGGSPDADLIEEIIALALKLARDRTDRGDLKLLASSLKDLRHAFRVFAPYRTVRKVSIFGSARMAEDLPEYEQAWRFSNRLTQLGFMVITGAGPGIMEAAQAGAGRDMSFGVNIRLPYEQQANPTILEDPKLVNFKYFFTRKLIFVKETDGIALFPGGFGTLDEGFEALTLIQTGKANPLPVVFVDRPGGGYWKDWLACMERQMLARRMIDPEDMRLFRVTDDVEEAVGEILGFYRNFHSSRFVRRDLVIRLLLDPSDGLLSEIEGDFADILESGTFERTAALPEESNLTAELLALPRIKFHFNRRSYGRLRQLIDRLNREAPMPRATTPAASEGLKQLPAS